MRKIPRLAHGPAVIDAVRWMQDFDASSMHGRVISSNGLHWTDYGRLRGADYDLYKEQCEDIRYVIWSYRTPIMWVTQSGSFHVVTEHISAVTGRHQTMVRLAMRTKE